MTQTNPEPSEQAEDSVAEGDRSPGGSEAPSYYTAPEYVGASPWATSATKIPPPRPSVSAVITVATLGITMLIMGLGLAISIAFGHGNNEILLSAAGVCLLVVAAVLAYAGLKGLNAGWFIAASVIGAFMFGPVVMLAGSITYNQSNYVDETVSWSGNASIPLQSVTRTDNLLTETVIPGGDPNVGFLNPTATVIELSGNKYVLDLTGASPNDENNWSITTFSGTELTVLIPDDAYVHIYDDGSIESEFVATTWDSPNQTTRIETTGWIANYQEGNLDLLSDIWSNNYSDLELFINIHADLSKITFVRVANPDPRTLDDSETTPQSGSEEAQSGDQPQSGPTKGESSTEGTASQDQKSAGGN